MSHTSVMIGARRLSRGVGAAMAVMTMAVLEAAAVMGTTATRAKMTVAVLAARVVKEEGEAKVEVGRGVQAKVSAEVRRRERGRRRHHGHS